MTDLVDMLLIPTQAHDQAAQPKAHPRCVETLLRLLDDPTRLAEVERYMQKYPGFDYGGVPARIAELRGYKEG